MEGVVLITGNIFLVYMYLYACTKCPKISVTNIEKNGIF